MVLKIGETELELVNAPIINGNAIEFEFTSNSNVEELENLLSDATSISEYDKEVLLETYKGFTNLLYIKKNISERTFTACLTQPIITIKGLSNTDEVIAILKEAGYEVE